MKNIELKLLIRDYKQRIEFHKKRNSIGDSEIVYFNECKLKTLKERIKNKQ